MWCTCAERMADGEKARRHSSTVTNTSVEYESAKPSEIDCGKREGVYARKGGMLLKRKKRSR